MTARKSAKDIFPVPSLSTSTIIFLISSFFGSNPRALIATWNSVRRAESEAHREKKTPPPPRTHDCDQCSSSFFSLLLLLSFFFFFTLSSLTSMYPEPSVSNSSKASLISCFCSSVSSGLGVVFLRGGGTGPCRDGLLALVAWWGTGGKKKKKNVMVAFSKIRAKYYDTRNREVSGKLNNNKKNKK